ncbi:HdeD family acid-resistance protein [Branchiibius sp. NY16-3462-2]|uniref:HdeD family acid-resistance protein n=1 Tax=Branchiibius sp. NY16-3462-2 TaxID=1807500 RepID=UPI000798BD7A|nr:DUF308 domain-containing protein [Branchiibius sp. NY16-3462-2]KYH45117.1 hypothetical protein AZH51_14630 [Branchiibius sp. NY16-3462-2]
MSETLISDPDDSGLRIDANTLERTVAQRFKQFLLVTGAVLLVIGLLILIWPGHTAKAITALLAIGVLFSALGNAAVALTPGLPTRARVIAAIVAVLFAWAGIWALFNLGSTTVGLAFVVGLFIGIAWIIDGIAALVTLGDAPSKVWAVIFGLISIVAGVILLIGPISGAAIIWLLVGIAFVVMGVLQIIRGLRFGNQTIKATL